MQLFCRHIEKSENRLENERFTFENRPGILKPSQGRTPTTSDVRDDENKKGGILMQTKKMQRLELENGS